MVGCGCGLRKIFFSPFNATYGGEQLEIVVVFHNRAALPYKVSVHEITEQGLSAQAMLNEYNDWSDSYLN